MKLDIIDSVVDGKLTLARDYKRLARKPLPTSR